MDRAALRELGVDWRVTPGVVAIYAVSSVVGAFISLDPSGGRLAQVATAAGVATAFAVVATVAAWVTVARLRLAFLAGPGFLVVAAIIGALRGLVLHRVASNLDVVLSGGWIGITLSAALSAVVWIGLGGLVVASQSVHRRRYRSMLLRATHDSLGDVTFDWDAQPEVLRMRASLSGASPTHQDPTAEDLARTSAAIRWEIERTLRPLSHRLWFGAIGQEPRARWLWVLHDAVADFTVPVVPLNVLWLAGALVGGLALLGVAPGMIAAGLSTAILTVSSAAGTRLMRNRTSVLIGSMLVVGCGSLTVFGTDLIMRVMGFSTSLAWGNGVAVGLWLAVVGMLLVSATIALAAADRQTVLDVAGHRAARASAYLHNSLQSELTGLAMQFDAAARDADPHQARAALERLDSLVNRSLADDFAAFEQDPVSRAANVATAWAGISDVSFVIDDRARDDRRLMAAVLAAEELIANAIRHSGATVIDVRVAPSPAGLALVCQSNTSGVRATGTGLGSRLLASVSSDGVHTEESPAGTTYRIEVR